jgi:hypothetical protein
MGGDDVILERIVLFCESRSGSTKGVLGSRQGGVRSIKSGSDFDARGAKRSTGRRFKRKRRFANW